MAARASKSKKDSVANSAPQRDDKPTFFLDKCLGRYDVSDALKALNANVELHTDHFAEDAPDHEWLPVVGQRGWVVLTKDRHLLNNQLQIVSLLKANTHVFVLRAADMTGEDMANAFSAAHHDMLKFIEKYPTPYIAQLTRAGVVSMLVMYSDIVERLD